MVRVVMDIFINQNASKLFIDFLLCVLLKSGTRGFFVLARVCSSCAGVNIQFYTRNKKIETGRKISQPETICRIFLGGEVRSLAKLELEHTTPACFISMYLISGYVSDVCTVCCAICPT